MAAPSPTSAQDLTAGETPPPGDNQAGGQNQADQTQASPPQGLTTLTAEYTNTYTFPITAVWFSPMNDNAQGTTGLSTGTTTIWAGNSFSPLFTSNSSPTKTSPASKPKQTSSPSSPASPEASSNPASSSIPSNVMSQSVRPSSNSSTLAHSAAEGPGLTSGAVAGISIGCATFGILLGVLLAFLLCRGRGRKPQTEYAVPLQYRPDEKFIPGDKGLPSIPTSYSLQLDQFLLDSKPDSVITSELGSLGQLVQQHVESHYHLQPVQGSPNALASILVSLGLEDQQPITIVDLASLALDHRTRHAALQHIISRVAFESTVLGGATPISLLPTVAKELIDSLPPVESLTGNTEAMQVALTRWRQLSVFLLHQDRSERTPLTPTEDVSTHSAQRLAVSLGRFLEVFVPIDREARYEQENHLREVIVECATFGYLIFSQPSEFQFQYNTQSKLNAVVTCPGLAKISDEEGRRYTSPHVLATPVVEVI